MESQKGKEQGDKSRTVDRSAHRGSRGHSLNPSLQLFFPHKALIFHPRVNGSDRARSRTLTRSRVLQQQQQTYLAGGGRVHRGTIPIPAAPLTPSPSPDYISYPSPPVYVDRFRPLSSRGGGARGEQKAEDGVPRAAGWRGAGEWARWRRRPSPRARRDQPSPGVRRFFGCSLDRKLSLDRKVGFRVCCWGYCVLGVLCVVFCGGLVTVVVQ